MSHVRRVLQDDAKASALRTMIRAGIVLVTAFGFQLDASQVAAIQVFSEAVIQFGRSMFGGVE